MTAVIAIQGMEAADLSRAVAQQLTGPTVVLPYSALRRDWIVKPAGDETDVASARQQTKLLVAGYVRAGYHVVLAVGPESEGTAIDEILGLIRTVRNVHTLCIAVVSASGPDAATNSADLICELRTLRPHEAARRVWEALPPEGDRCRNVSPRLA